MERFPVFDKNVTAETVVVNAVPGKIFQVVDKVVKVVILPIFVGQTCFPRHAAFFAQIVRPGGDAFPALFKIAPFGNVVHDIEGELIVEHLAFFAGDDLPDALRLGGLRS